MMLIRDRIKELRRVRARDLVANPRNWRVHPGAQAAALRGLLAEIGYADALLARELADGRLQLIDGHLRAETTPNSMVPVLVLDVDEQEANKLLLTLDPLAAMAEADADRVNGLLETVRTDSAAVGALLERIAGESAWQSSIRRTRCSIRNRRSIAPLSFKSNGEHAQANSGELSVTG